MNDSILKLIIIGLKSEIEEQSKTKEFYIKTITNILRSMLDDNKISTDDYKKSIDILNELEF